VVLADAHLGPGPFRTPSGGRLLPRNECRRFEAEFSDRSKQWMLWAEAKQMAALDTYAAEHKLKLPAT
jgi:hypothetical protein